MSVLQGFNGMWLLVILLAITLLTTVSRVVKGLIHEKDEWRRHAIDLAKTLKDAQNEVQRAYNEVERMRGK